MRIEWAFAVIEGHVCIYTLRKISFCFETVAIKSFTFKIAEK